MKRQVRKAIFVGLLNSLKDYVDKIEVFHDDMRKHTEEFIWNLDADLLACTIEAATKIAEDEDAWVDWWVWENNFGKKAQFASRSDGVAIDLSSPEKLFDFIQEGRLDVN